MISFTLTLKGVSTVLNWKVKQVKRLTNLTVPLKQIAKEWYALEQQWFNSEGGGRWVPLSPSYAAYKATAAPGKPLLRFTDKMYKEFTGQPGHYDLTSTSLQIYVLGVPYWVEHEDGFPATHLPQRKVIAPWMTDKIDSWHLLISRHLVGR